jgi:hypothetical protein
MQGFAMWFAGKPYGEDAGRMTLKRIVRAILPAKISRALGSIRMLYRERRLRRFSLPQAFNEVYKKRMWQQGQSLSGVGSEGLLAERYVAFVRDYIQKHRIKTIVDAGCGDFNVGSRLCDDVSKCFALDASSYIIHANQKRYADISNVSFQVADLVVTTFPAADLVLIRQVLQHLSNDQIERVLTNLERSKWDRVLVAEAVADPSNDANANLDFQSHSVRTRVNFGSGVFIDRPPFNRPAKRVAVIDDASPDKDASTRLLVFELTNRETTA